MFDFIKGIWKRKESSLENSEETGEETKVEESASEEKINNAEILEPEEENVPEEIKEKKRKTDFYVELALFCILGILIGIAIKTEANKRITIGYNDYKMKIVNQDYDINKLQIEEAQKRAEAQEQESATQPEDENIVIDSEPQEGEPETN